MGQYFSLLVTSRSCFSVSGNFNVLRCAYSYFYGGYPLIYFLYCNFTAFFKEDFVSALVFCILLWLKSRSRRRASYHSAFMGSHLASLVDEFSFKEMKTWSLHPRLHFLVFVFGVKIRRIRRQEEVKIPLCNSGDSISSERVTKSQRQSSSAKAGSCLNTLTVFTKNFHHSPPIGFELRIQPELP